MCKALGYETDKVSTFLGIMFWSGKTENKQTNKQTHFRLKKCYEKMDHVGRIETNREVRVTLCKVKESQLS